MFVEMSQDGKSVRVTVDGQTFVVSIDTWSYAISHPGKFKVGEQSGKTSV